jgi:hypothetical protein
MSGKYAFSKTLKEVRFLFCQTGEASGATRYVGIRRLLIEEFWDAMEAWMRISALEAAR